MHVLCRLCSLSPNDLTTTCHDFLTLYPRLFFLPDHSRLFWTVKNSRKQSGTPQPSSPTFQGLRRPIPARSRLSYGPTRPLSTTKVGKSRLLGRLSMTGALLALNEGNPLVWPVNDPSCRPVTRGFDVSLIYAWTNGWTNGRDASGLRRHRVHYDMAMGNFCCKYLWYLGAKLWNATPVAVKLWDGADEMLLRP